jgi:hypothetical protein
VIGGLYERSVLGFGVFKPGDFCYGWVIKMKDF